jgi:hypothetical protein
LNYLNAATGTTGTNTSNVVYSASPTLTGTTTIADAVINHIKGSGSPTGVLGLGSNGGTGETFTIDGSDVGGNISVTTGNANSAANASVIDVTFATAYATAPRAVLITPANATTKALAIANQCLVTTISTTGFTITSGTTRLVLSTTYKWYYMVIQ